MTPMPKYRIGWKRVVYVVVEAEDKEQAADRAWPALMKFECGESPMEISEELVWCEELPDEKDSSLEDCEHGNNWAEDPETGAR